MLGLQETSCWLYPLDKLKIDHTIENFVLRERFKFNVIFIATNHFGNVLPLHVNTQ